MSGGSQGVATTQNEHVFNGGAKQFSHTPRLRDAVARTMRRFSVRDFGDVSEAGGEQMIAEVAQPLFAIAARGIVGGIDTQ